MQIKIRRARPEDIEWIVVQLRKFSKFYGTKKSLFGDDDFVRSGMLSMIQVHLVLIADCPLNGPVGFISGIVTPHMYNPNIQVLCETFWWVSEDHRGSRAGLLLLDSFLAWGQANVDWITFALESHSPVKDKCLLKRGFKPQEKNYLMEVS